VEQAIAAQFIKGTVANRLERVDVAWDVDCVMDIDGSKYSAQGDAFSDHVAKALGTNQQFAIYCGHSGPSGMMTRKGNLSFEAMLGDSEPKGRTGVFLTTGCYACQARGFGGQGYGLDLLGAAEGPAAVIGAYAESYAAAGQLALDGALQCLSSHSQGDSKSQGNAASKADEKSRAEFVGDYWLAVQAGLARGKISPAEFYLYDRADGSNGTVSLEDQRKEHLEMWGLFGDPAMPIPTVQVTE
ncbi:MAG: C25 family cysteine peptidase, partial [Planctomycetota bacterium]